MTRRRKTPQLGPPDPQRTPPRSELDAAPAGGELADWVLSLPWVLEAATDGSQPGVRLFVVDCVPLQRRQMWLVTGLARLDADAKLGIAAVMPGSAVHSARALGWVVVPATPLPEDHVLVRLEHEPTAAREEIEAFVLTAYTYAMA